MMLCPLSVRSQVADSVDAVDYDITLDLSSGNKLWGYSDITLRLLRPCQTIGLDMLCVVDSVRVGGVRQTSNSLAALPTAGIGVGQDFHVEVWYHSTGYVEDYGWGGMHFENNLSYNLGVGFDANPHVMGRVIFPCRDNFTDKATYTLRVVTKAGWTTECGGERQSVAVDSAGCEHSVWRIGQQTPTYLVSVSQADWTRIHDTIPSLYGDYPLTVGYRMRQEQNVRRAFEELDSVVPMYERCFGPYRWGRIGYIATTKGSMEHVNNIALDATFIASTAERAQSTIAHELGHAWFGNLVTCATEGDMWINEGGASFCSEVAMESVRGRRDAIDYYQRNLENVLRTTHVTDGTYRPLHNMPHAFTYGSTTYDKGWMVWHSLRGHLGDSLFYAAMNRLMASCAFGNIDAYGVRDSLSLYTGVDLTDFFDFHVFGPGFVDYHVELQYDPSCGVQDAYRTVSQQGVGTGNLPRSGRIPVTLYGMNNGVFDSATVWLSLSDEPVQDIHFSYSNIGSLAPQYIVLDPDCHISDAATVVSQSMEGYGISYTLSTAHLKVKSPGEMRFTAEHHWGPAFGNIPGGVERQAQRYWMLRGTWEATDALQAQFHFVRTSFAGSDFDHLDDGLLTGPSSVDSLVLLYRADSHEGWRMIPSSRTGNNNEGYLVADSALPGEYTLAVVDLEHLAIHRPATVEVQLFPNPLQPGQALTVEVPTDQPFEVSIFDAEGRCVWQKTGCRSGQKLSPALTKGTYFVRIENNFISLQSKLIQL